MAEPAKERRKSPLLPLWAYVVMNVVCLLACVLIYVVAQVWAANQKPPLVSVGLVPVLAMCYLCFTVVCFYDAWIDRRAERERRRRPDTEPSDMMLSQEKTRRPD